MRQIRVHGQAKKHHHPVLGLNGRLDTIQAAIVLCKLDIFDQEVAQRQAVAERYTGLLNEVVGVELPFVPEGNTSVYAQYTILSNSRVRINAKLGELKIPSVSYYAVPLHLQPVFLNLGYVEGDFPVAERIASNGLSLPMSPGLTAADQDQIQKGIIKSLEV